MSQQGRYPPTDHDIYRGPISKCSGKETAFIIWLKNEGKARFFREHAYNLSTRSHVDMQIVDRYWKGLDKKTKDKYKNIEKSEHNSKENIERRRMNKENKRVSERHKNLILEAKTKEAHKATIKELNKELGPKFVPSLPRVSDPNGDLLAHRSNLRKAFELMSRNRFFIREKTFDSLYDELFTFISVNVGFQYLDPYKVKLFCYPLEISLITFTFREGIKMKKTIHLDLDPAVIFQNTKVAMTPEEQRKCVTDISKETFLPTPQFTGTKENAIKAWFEFKEAWLEIRPNIRSQLLCEKDCLNQKAVLTNLAYAADMKEWHFVTNNVDKRIFPIEDFAMALAGTYEVKIQDKEVLDHFKVDYYPFQKGVVCEHHDQLKLAGDKLYCQQSMAMTSIYKLLQFLHKHDIFKFTTIYSPEIHEFCKIFKGSGTFPKNSTDILAIYDPKKHKNRLADFVLVPSDKQNFPLEASRPASAKNDKRKRCTAYPERFIRDSDMSDSSDESDRPHFESNASINRGIFKYESSSNTVEDPPPPTLNLRKTMTNSGHQQQQAPTTSKQSHQNYFNYQDDVTSTPRPRINFTTKIQENDEDRRKSSSPPRQNMLRETNSGFGGNTRNPSSWNFQTNFNSNFYDRAARENPSSSRNLSDNQERNSRTTRLLPSRGSDRQLDQGNRRESRIAELFSAIDIDGSQTVINFVRITSEERMAMKPCRLGVDFDPFDYTPN